MRVTAVEVAVELDGHRRGLYRIEGPGLSVQRFDREAAGKVTRLRLDVEGREVVIDDRSGLRPSSER